MSDTVVLAREETERGELVLRRREGEGGEMIYEIISNGVFLMTNSNAPSARALSIKGLEPLQGRDGLRVLVGGLGMGYTLQAALEHPGVVLVEVVEIEPLVVAWAEEYFGPLNGDALGDERTRVVVADLAEYLRLEHEQYDALLFDVDNGPAWIVFESNAAVYVAPTLRRLRELLRPGGVLAVWAAEHTPDFLDDLGQTFDWADEVLVHETDQRGCEVEYFIYRAGVASTGG